MAIQQWWFFSVPHLLWHGASVYLRGPVTLTPIAERLALEQSLPIFPTKVCRGWDSNTKPFACEANALAPCATAAVVPYGFKSERFWFWKLWTIVIIRNKGHGREAGLSMQKTYVWLARLEGVGKKSSTDLNRTHNRYLIIRVKAWLLTPYQFSQLPCCFIPTVLII